MENQEVGTTRILQINVPGKVLDKIEAIGRAMTPAVSRNALIADYLRRLAAGEVKVSLKLEHK